MDKSDRFIYRPNQKKGFHCYDGMPCATKGVFESIGEIGIAEIHRVMKEMVEVRKKMFGYGKPEYYGFTDREVFFDLETATGIELHANANKSVVGRKGYEFPLPELLDIEGSYLLKQTFPFGTKLGKRAFKNRVKDWQSGNFLIKSVKEKQDAAIRAIRWLKTHDFELLMQVLKE